MAAMRSLSILSAVIHRHSHEYGSCDTVNPIGHHFPLISVLKTSVPHDLAHVYAARSVGMCLDLLRHV